MNIPEPSLFTRFEGGWCDNCRTAYPFIASRCPSCGLDGLLRPATVTVEPRGDADGIPAADRCWRCWQVRVLGVRAACGPCAREEGWAA